MGGGYSESIDDIVIKFREKFYNLYMKPFSSEYPKHRNSGSVGNEEIKDSLIELGTFVIMLAKETRAGFECPKDSLDFIWAIGLAAYGYSQEQTGGIIARAIKAKKDLRMGIRKDGAFRGYSLTQILADYGDSFIQGLFSRQRAYKKERGRPQPVRDSGGNVSPLVTEIARGYFAYRSKCDPGYKFGEDKNFDNYMRLVHGMK